VSPERKKLTVNDLRTADAAELDFQLKESRQRIFDLRFKAASEEIADNKELSRLKRDVARILTIQTERRRASARAGQQAPASPAAPQARPSRQKAAAAPPRAEGKSDGR
jgi:large subunit ribosomal protein L29